MAKFPQDLSLRIGAKTGRVFPGCAVSSVVERFLDTEVKTPCFIGVFADLG